MTTRRRSPGSPVCGGAVHRTHRTATTQDTPADHHRPGRSGGTKGLAVEVAEVAAQRQGLLVASAFEEGIAGCARAFTSSRWQ
jgi:hypothetical protein